MTGKWHVPGAPRFDVVKDVRPGMPRAVGSGYNRPKSPEDYAKGWKPWDRAHGGFWQGGTHWTKVVGDNSVEFLKQAAREKAPFFMYLAFNAPHDPRQAPKEYVDMYPLSSVGVPRDFLPEYPFKDKIGCSRGLRDEKLAPFPRTEYAVKVNRQEYFACITYVDVQVGRILRALEETGKAKNTYVIYTADHGLAVGHHGLMGKQNMYEHSMRPPFIMSGPGIRPGTRITTPIYLQDAMATSLELAGAKRPAYVEFKSLMPLVRGERKVQYESIYGKYMNLQRMIVRDGWKLMMYPSARKERLYNLKADPFEMNDLRADPRHAAVARKLKSEFRKLQKEMGDDFDVDKPPAKKRRGR
jgi:choline-sulfatase